MEISINQSRDVVALDTEWIRLVKPLREVNCALPFPFKFQRNKIVSV